MHFRFSTISLLISSAIVVITGCLAPSMAGAEEPIPSSDVINRIKSDGNLRLGMYLGFEGLSFRERGKVVGLEVELARLLCEEVSVELGKRIEPEIVNQEWSQIIKVLRDEKYDAVLSAVIPNPMYDRYQVRYTQSYLDTGPAICCREVDGQPANNITSSVESLADKRIVVINDPAVRRVLRLSGVYVPGDEQETDLERKFPKEVTESYLRQMGISKPLIAVREIVQIDEMPIIYDMISSGSVDAGVIDLGIIWWVSATSPRWSRKIFAFDDPIGPYIYSVTTRSEDLELGELLNRAVGRMLRNPKYAEICQRWHGNEVFQWNLKPESFLENVKPDVSSSELSEE